MISQVVSEEQLSVARPQPTGLQLGLVEAPTNPRPTLWHSAQAADSSAESVKLTSSLVRMDIDLNKEFLLAPGQSCEEEEEEEGFGRKHITQDGIKGPEERTLQKEHRVHREDSPGQGAGDGMAASRAVQGSPRLPIVARRERALWRMQGTESEQGLPGGSPTESLQQQQKSLSKYEAQKQRDWRTFEQFLRNLRSPVSVTDCTTTEVLQFLSYLDQFGKTKVHDDGCPHFGKSATARRQVQDLSCSCPYKQAWGSLDAIVARLRAAFEENRVGVRGSDTKAWVSVAEGIAANPFASEVVKQHLKEVKKLQNRSRGGPPPKRTKREGDKQGHSRVAQEGEASTAETGGKEGSGSSACAQVSPSQSLPFNQVKPETETGILVGQGGDTDSIRNSVTLSRLVQQQSSRLSWIEAPGPPFPTQGGGTLVPVKPELTSTAATLQLGRLDPSTQAGPDPLLSLQGRLDAVHTHQGWAQPLLRQPEPQSASLVPPMQSLSEQTWMQSQHTPGQGSSLGPLNPLMGSLYNPLAHQLTQLSSLRGQHRNLAQLPLLQQMPHLPSGAAEQQGPDVQQALVFHRSLSLQEMAIQQQAAVTRLLRQEPQRRSDEPLNED